MRAGHPGDVQHTFAAGYTPVEGDIFVNTKDGDKWVYDGSDWVMLHEGLNVFSVPAPGRQSQIDDALALPGGNLEVAARVQQGDLVIDPTNGAAWAWTYVPFPAKPDGSHIITEATAGVGPTTTGEPFGKAFHNTADDKWWYYNNAPANPRWVPFNEAFPPGNYGGMGWMQFVYPGGGGGGGPQYIPEITHSNGQHGSDGRPASAKQGDIHVWHRDGSAHRNISYVYDGTNWLEMDNEIHTFGTAEAGAPPWSPTGHAGNPGQTGQIMPFTWRGDDLDEGAIAVNYTDGITWVWQSVQPTHEFPSTNPATNSVAGLTPATWTFGTRSATRSRLRATTSTTPLTGSRGRTREAAGSSSRRWPIT